MDDTLATVDFKYRFDLSLTNCHSLSLRDNVFEWDDKER